MESEERNRFSKEIDRLKERIAEKNREIENLKTNYLFSGTVIDGIDEEIMVLDSDYNIMEVNRAFLTRYGLKKEDALNKKCYEIKEQSGAPCNLDKIPCPLKQAVKKGEKVETTYDFKDSKGNIKELVIIIYPLEIFGQKNNLFIEISKDVTFYRSLIREFRDSENRFRAILDTATDGIISIDKYQKIVLFNNGAEKIFGYSREEILGKDLKVLIPVQYGDHYRFVRRFMGKRESDVIGKTISLTALRKSGKEFPVELSLSFHEIDYGLTFTAIIRDVSEQKKLEKKLLQSERLAAVGQTVAHVAHELRNSLMIIGGFSNQIKTGLSDGRNLKKLEMILAEVIRLEKLVAVLGDFTKEYKLVKRSSDINVVINDVLKIMTGVYSSKKYHFRKFLSSELPDIHCDPDKLKQVFINIISNGLEAMVEGGIILISTEMVQGAIEIQISDEGIGISEEALQHIFEPFYTTREHGSGFGLPISYKIIEAHEGEISAVSLPGKGASFTIKLPSM